MNIYKKKQKMQIGYLNRLFNISTNEWPRIRIAWTLRFLFRMGFVIGWTILLAMFVARVGIQYLAYLFIANALLIIVGTAIYSEIIHRMSKDILIVYTALLAGCVLYFATFFPLYSDLIFFSLILIGGAILLGQLDIMLALFIEDLFSPLESERAFPLIESAETTGGIIGGIIISLLAPSIPAYKFLFIWVIAILLIIPIVFVFRNYAKKLPFLEFKQKHQKKTGRIKKIIEGYKNVRTIPFLKGLMLVVLLQWIFINLLEFQYITAIKQSILNENEFENIITLKLGYLHIIFSGSALVMQLMFAGRFISSLGIVGSLTLQPLVMFFNTIGMTLRFNTMSAVVSRTSYEITNVMYQNAYHSSYYNVKNDMREGAREFLEGLVKPFGAIIGMILLLNFQNFLYNEDLARSINLVMIGVTIISLMTLIRLKEKYTLEANKRLAIKGDHYEKINAIEILSQKGHKNAAKMLLVNLTDPDESDMIKEKILEALGNIQDPQTIPEILDCLSAPSNQVRLAAVKALEKFENLGIHAFSQAFSKYRVINTLKKLFKNEASEEIRANIIIVLAKLNNAEIADFIIDTMKNSKNQRIINDCIKACGLFHDPNAAHYIEPYLYSENPEIKASCIAALWQFPKYRDTLREELKKLLKNKSKNKTRMGIQITGEIGESQNVALLIDKLRDRDMEIKHEAIIALAKIGYEKSIEPFIETLLKHTGKIHERSKEALQHLPQKTKKIIDTLIHQRASEEINEILNHSNKQSLAELDKKTLEKLKKIYQLVNEHQEVLKINELLKT